MYAKTKHVVDAAQLLRDMQLKGLVPAPETYGEMFLFKGPATTEIYALSLHAALPI